MQLRSMHWHVGLSSELKVLKVLKVLCALWILSQLPYIGL